ncbi:hypothetical protein vseg_013809 [Gypsophila vaccaria]
MVADYYTILHVHRDATVDDLRKSYHRLAKKYHPDKNPANAAFSDAKFKQISEAYDILSDPHKRRLYDHSLISGNPQPPPTTAGRGGGGGGGSPYSAAGGVSGESGRRSPADGRPSWYGSERDYKKIFEEMARTGYKFSGSREAETSTVRKEAAIDRSLPCSLEELYNGAKKMMKITRTIINYSGQERTIRDILTIDIKLGWKKGTKITFPEKGNKWPGIIPSDIIFTIDEKPHPVFKRDGDDLIIDRELTLLEALTGRKKLELKTLDGRNIVVPVTEIVTPGYEMIVPSEGMPISKDPHKRGNLRVRFIVKFPSKLTEEQKVDLHRVLDDIT